MGQPVIASTGPAARKVPCAFLKARRENSMTGRSRLLPQQWCLLIFDRDGLGNRVCCASWDGRGSPELPYNLQSGFPPETRATPYHFGYCDFAYEFYRKRRAKL
jgi:hypothetical protein